MGKPGIAQKSCAISPGRLPSRREWNRNKLVVAPHARTIFGGRARHTRLVAAVARPAPSSACLPASTRTWRVEGRAEFLYEVPVSVLCCGDAVAGFSNGSVTCAANCGVPFRDWWRSRAVVCHMGACSPLTQTGRARLNAACHALTGEARVGVRCLAITSQPATSSRKSTVSSKRHSRARFLGFLLDEHRGMVHSLL
jgi:hypothetical protein